LARDLARLECYLDRKERVLEANARELAAAVREREEAMERLRAESAALAEANARLADANRQKSVFVGSVSHELRTPLTAILAAARLLRRRLADAGGGRLGDEGEDLLAVVVDEAERLGTLVKELLDLNLLESGRVEWRFEAVAAADVVRRATAATAPLFAEGGVSLRNDLPDDLPDVRGHRDRLVQVLTNLLANAARFTPAGGCVRVRGKTTDGSGATHRGSRGAAYVLLSVSDTGPGIARRDRARIFERFVRAADPPDGRPAGTGLGLTIAREIAEAHGGWIRLESTSSRGSTFSVGLPVAPPERRRGGRRPTATGRRRIDAGSDVAAAPIVRERRA
jgi:signal transduction histidine kinase